MIVLKGGVINDVVEFFKLLRFIFLFWGDKLDILLIELVFLVIRGGDLVVRLFELNVCFLIYDVREEFVELLWWL